MKSTPDRHDEFDDDPLLKRIGDLGSAEVESLRLPEAIGPYEVEGILGEGGMGVVLRARQSAPLHRLVALKLMRAAAISERNVKRFHREMTALARLAHPNIVRIFDAGQTERGEPYFVMELIEDALPLDRYVRTWNPELSERLLLFQAILHGVAHAHERGVLHRDLKPGNVLITRANGIPHVHVIDFGVARIVDQGKGFTRTGDTPGTPSYMAPELLFDRSTASERSDVYSLGVILYALLTGRPPFTPEERAEDDLVRAMKRRLTKAPKRPSLVAPPGERRPALDPVVLKALHVDPRRRYESIVSLEAAMSAALARSQGMLTRRGFVLSSFAAGLALALWGLTFLTQEDAPRGPGEKDSSVDVEPAKAEKTRTPEAMADHVPVPPLIDPSAFPPLPHRATVETVRSLLAATEPVKFGTAEQLRHQWQINAFKALGTSLDAEVPIPPGASHLMLGPEERTGSSVAFLTRTTSGVHVHIDARPLQREFASIPIRYVPPGKADEHAIGSHPVLVFPGTLTTNDLGGGAVCVERGVTVRAPLGTILVPRDQAALVEHGDRWLRLLPGFHHVPDHGVPQGTQTRVQAIPLLTPVARAIDLEPTECVFGAMVFTAGEDEAAFGQRVNRFDEKNKQDAHVYELWKDGFEVAGKIRAIAVDREHCLRVWSSVRGRNSGVVLGPGFYGQAFLDALELDRAIDRLRVERFLPRSGEDARVETYRVRFPHH